jgi:hypothetical protein
MIDSSEALTFQSKGASPGPAKVLAGHVNRRV